MWNASTRTSLVTGLAALALAAPAAAQACEGSGAGPSELSVGEARGTVLCLINQRRHQAGVRSLRAEARLARAAQKHSHAMDARNFFSHSSPGGGDPFSRIRSSGYLAGASSWSVGEIIRWGPSAAGTPRATVAAWMQSPPHRSVMLSGRFRHIGIGVAFGSPSGDSSNAAIYTADLGNRGG